jgi:hypothetical protein
MRCTTLAATRRLLVPLEVVEHWYSPPSGMYRQPGWRDMGLDVEELRATGAASMVWGDADAIREQSEQRRERSGCRPIARG